ncbi:MAG: hypothetical protein AAB427_12625, partial [Chloroflexota bacterium]
MLLESTPSRIEGIMQVIKRFTPSEVSELAQRLNAMQARDFVLSPEADEFWRKQVEAQGGPPPSLDDPFIDGITVRQYVALSEPEQAAIWDRLYAEELDKLEKEPERDVRSRNKRTAGQKRNPPRAHR